MDAGNIAKQLHSCIQEGDYAGVRLLLEEVWDQAEIQEIQNHFVDRDPVVFAIDNCHQQIAIHLIEKGFTYWTEYPYPGKQCDQWCYSNHGNVRCPHSQYTARDLAAAKHLLKVQQVIDDITQGRRRPGDGLDMTPVRPIPEGMDVQKEKPNREVKFTDVGHNRKPMSSADIARDTLKNFGPSYVDEDGNTLLHQYVKCGAVVMHVFANGRVSVNAKNKHGDTALHLAVRLGNLGAVESLLQCGADLQIRNNLGLTPSDEASGKTEEGDLVRQYQPGLLSALQDGNSTAMSRLIHLWCNTRTVVKDGKTILQYATELEKSNSVVMKCHRMLKDFHKTNELLHAVLADDVEAVKMIKSKNQKDITVNIRHRDKYGHTPLSIAIDYHNIEMVECLVSLGSRMDIRIREHGTRVDNQVTIPLLFKALDGQCPEEIAKFLHERMPTEEREKDNEGNTALSRAIRNSCSTKFIDWLISASNGYNLLDRNKTGLHARELALKLNRKDVIRAIDRFVYRQLNCNFLMDLQVTFYGAEHLDFSDKESGQSLLQHVMDNGHKSDIQALKCGKEIEARAVECFTAAANGDVKTVEKLNCANYRDKNGYNALHRAVVFNQFEVAKKLILMRPVLKSLPDNCNRYPLHYAYALPEEQGRPFIDLILAKNAKDFDLRHDKDGRVPADYASLRDTEEISQMLYNARTLDAYGEKLPTTLDPVPQEAVIMNGNGHYPDMSQEQR